MFVFFLHLKWRRRFDLAFVLMFFQFQIVDSIMALFRVDYSGRGELADRQQKLAQMLSRLQKIAEGSYFHILFMWECLHKNC